MASRATLSAEESLPSMQASFSAVQSELENVRYLGESVVRMAVLTVWPVLRCRREFGLGLDWAGRARGADLPASIHSASSHSFGLFTYDMHRSRRWRQRARVKAIKCLAAFNRPADIVSHNHERFRIALVRMDSAPEPNIVGMWICKI